MRLILPLFLSLLANTAQAYDFTGPERMWFTLAAYPYQVTGTAGKTATMQRFPAIAGLQDLRSECFGAADAQGLGHGHCVNTAPDGDLWIEAYVCDKPVAPPQGATAACEGTATVLGGTGKFAAISGSGHFTMLTTTTAPDGLKLLYAPGVYRLHW